MNEREYLAEMVEVIALTNADLAFLMEVYEVTPEELWDENKEAQAKA